MLAVNDSSIWERASKFDTIYSRFTELMYKHCLAVNEIFLYFYGDPNYSSDESAKASLYRVYNVMVSTLNKGNKLVFVGCGKSYRIVAKTVSTYQSLGLSCAIIHPTDALHGDLGIISNGDALILCSTSGETEEILNLVNYTRHSGLFPDSEFIAVTGSADCSLTRVTNHTLLIHQPSYLRERAVQQGLSAPSISTTLMLLTLDCLGIAITDKGTIASLQARKAAFELRHPSGGIGLSIRNQPVTPEHSPTDHKEHETTTAEYFSTDSLSEFLEKLVCNDYVRIGSKIYTTVYLQRCYARCKDTGIPWQEMVQNLQQFEA
ncbi:HGL155Cp [Eremothecium sinecaudum]|uniref:HGL155Cp n=1 Tax=Eremothecium sinecaudum TaxID=45286 RepID=A0A120K2P4_9SACH|nr:HGL155Cp [Eremothecium sinecaudum]AMD22185.1 HGL155Cp [Eremothecium sinecaudum]